MLQVILAAVPRVPACKPCVVYIYKDMRRVVSCLFWIPHKLVSDLPVNTNTFLIHPPQKHVLEFPRKYVLRFTPTANKHVHSLTTTTECGR